MTDDADLPPGPGLCNATALRKAMRRVSQLYDSALAPIGLRGTQRSIMAHIARAQSDPGPDPGPAPSMGELAARLVLDRSALAHNLKPMEREGWVAITPDPADRRSRLVALTPAGRAKLVESMPLWRGAQARFEAAYGADQARALRATLEEIAATDFGGGPGRAG